MPDDHAHPETRGPGPRSGLRRPFLIGLIRPELAQAAFDRQRRLDSRGDRIHTWIAAAALVLVCGPTSIAELGMIPLYFFATIRLWATWRTTGWSLRLPATIACVIFGLWMCASVLWSPDRMQGLNESTRLRWLVWIPLLFPVIHRRGVLIGAVTVGFLTVNSAQLWHAIGDAAAIDWMTFDRLPHRNSAWFDPAVAGSVMMVPLGLHLGAFSMGLGRWRVIGGLGAMITLLGLLATGTRGAWMAGAALVGVACVILIVRLPSLRVRVATVTGLAAAAVLGGAIAWTLVGQTIASRYDAAVAEVNRALHDEDYASDTGSRIAMALWAYDAFRIDPIIGGGAGSFRSVMLERIERNGRPGVNVATHAHSTPFQIAATGGLIGLALIGVSALAVFTGAFRPRIGPGLAPPPDDPTGYHAGPGLALLGLMFVGAFDSLHVNTPTAAMLGAMIALCPGWRPAPDGTS